MKMDEAEAFEPPPLSYARSRSKEKKAEWPRKKNQKEYVGRSGDAHEYAGDRFSPRHSREGGNPSCLPPSRGRRNGFSG